MSQLPIQPVDPFAGTFEVDRDVLAERRARILARAVWIVTIAGAIATLGCAYDCECAGWYASPLLILPGVCAVVSWREYPYGPHNRPPPKQRAMVRALKRGLLASIVVALPWTIFALSRCTPEHVERCLLGSLDVHAQSAQG